MTRSQAAAKRGITKRAQITKPERARRNAQSWGAPTDAATGAARTEELTLPSGFVVDVRRPSLMAWLMNGRVPETFVAAAMSVNDEGGDEEAKANALDGLEGDELVKMFAFMRDVVTETVVVPRIVVGAAADSEDEIDPSRIPDADFFHIFNWAMQAPVPMAGGKEMSVGALTSFRPNKDVQSDSRSR